MTTAPDRAPLDASRVQARLRPPWTQLRVVAATESTNADLVGAAGGTPSGTVLVAEHQRAGRGRLDRGWTSPPRAGLTFSVLVRPRVPAASWGWLPLLAGVALHDAVREVVGIDGRLKWPNDLLLGTPPGKAAGILTQVAGDAVVVGIGLNISTTQEELAYPSATSLAVEGATDVDRAELLVAILTALGRRYTSWQDCRGDAEASGLADAYRDCCCTVGQQVAVTGTAGATVHGVAVGVDAAGRLRLAAGGTERVVAAGDVEHLRPTPAS